MDEESPPKSKSKKKVFTILALVCVAALIVIGVGVYASQPSLSEKEAKQIAEEHQGGTATSVVYEDDDEGPMYEVHVTNDEGDWEVEVDAETGEVTEVERDDGEEDDDDEKP